MSTVETAEERAAVVIPDDWQDLSWPALKSLASKLSDDPVRDKEDAVKAVEAAVEARGKPVIEAPPEMPDNGPAKGSAGVYIPDNWHEMMSVAEIVDLARRISPDGNPVEVIRAELARRS